MDNLVPRNIKPFLTSNSSLGCRSSSLNNGFDWYSLISVLMSFDPGSRVDSTNEAFFRINLLNNSLSYSFCSVVVTFFLESPSATLLDFPRIGVMSKSNMEILSTNTLVLG